MPQFSGFAYKRTPLGLDGAAATEQKWQCGASKRAPNKFGASEWHQEAPENVSCPTPSSRCRSDWQGSH